MGFRIGARKRIVQVFFPEFLGKRAIHSFDARNAANTPFGDPPGII